MSGQLKAATIYQHKGEMFVHGSSQTTAGLWILNEPVLHPATSSEIELGAAIRNCLASSRQNVPHPTDFSRMLDPVLKLAGVRSFETFVKSAKCVEVEMAETTISLRPMRNLGSKEGFEAMSQVHELVLAKDEELGRAAKSAIEESE